MPQVDVGPREALVHIHEDLDAQPGRLPLQPRRFRLLQQVRRPSLNEPVRSVFPWRCLNRPGIVGLRVSFRAHGRLLYLTAVAGERSSKLRRRQLLGLIQGLRFRPPRVPVHVRPNSGRPRTVFRLEIVAGKRSARQGRRQRLYSAEVQGPLRSACVIQHATTFGYAPPGARLQARLDPSHTKGNKWCRGRFRGVIKYHDGFVCPPRRTCRPPTDFPTEDRTVARFGFRVR
jgi:hypothetical protein